MILVSWLIAAALALTVVFAVYDYVRGAQYFKYGCEIPVENSDFGYVSSTA